jgi:hypothetical protein
MTKARWGGKIETERIIKRGDFELDVPMLAAPLPDEYTRSVGLPCRDSRSAKVDAMRVRLNTLLGLMGAVACIAVALAGYVAFESDTGSPTVGLAMVVASTATVAAIITAALPSTCVAVRAAPSPVALTHPYSIAKSEPDVRPDITTTGMPVSADSGAKLAMRLGTDADFPAQNAKEYRFWG